MFDFYFKKEVDYEKADGNPNLINFPADSNKGIFYLVRDNWNDHGYYSYSRIFFTFPKSHTPIGYPDVIDLGYIRIGKQNQRKNEKIFNDFSDLFNKLEDNYFSLSLNIKYYETLIELDDLDIIDSEIFFQRIKDIAYDIENLGDFKQDYPSYESLIFDQERVRTNPKRPANVINNSLIRNNTDSQHLLKLHNISNRKNLFSRYRINIEIKNYPALSLTSIDENKKIEKILNKNIYCLIGSNGCGKTTLLQNIFKETGKPNGVENIISAELTENSEPIEIPKTFYFSLSPFDSDLSEYIEAYSKVCTHLTPTN